MRPEEEKSGEERALPPLAVLAAAVAAMLEGRPHRMVSVRESESGWARAVREESGRTEGGSW